MYRVLLIFTLGLAALTITAPIPARAEAADMAAVAAALPQLECKVRAYRPSGDTAYNYRQLEKIEKARQRCIRQYRQALQARARQVQQELSAAEPAAGKHLQLNAQLTLINYILAQDLTASTGSSDRPGPPVEVSQQFGHH